jgi:hypothetical protein
MRSEIEVGVDHGFRKRLSPFAALHSGVALPVVGSALLGGGGGFGSWELRRRTLSNGQADIEIVYHELVEPDMSLAEKTWRRVAIHDAVLAWLRAERTKIAIRCTNSKLPRLLWDEKLDALLNQFDLDDAEQNHARLRLLYLIRSMFVGEIPPDTDWYAVDSLTDDDLPELRAVNHQDWTDPHDENELPKVALRKQFALQSTPDTWESPILFGHDKAGPFTILEGNNRLTAYARSGQSGLSIPVIVELSQLPCIWHIVDKTTPLLYDLWKGT